MKDPFVLPKHHAPGIPCGAPSLTATKRPLVFWYSEEPEGITCRHHACQMARFRMLAGRLKVLEAQPLAALEAFG